MMIENEDNFDRIEFLIARRRDGDLSRAESAQLDQLLRDQPELRELAKEYDRLDDALKSLSAEKPGVNWSIYQKEVRDRVNEPAMDSPAIHSEDVEFLLSRRGDRDLTAQEESHLAQVLQRNASIRKTADEYDHLNDAIAGLAADQPNIDWRAYEARLSNRLAAERARPSTTNRFSRFVMPAAMAACIALVSSLYWTTTSSQEEIFIADYGPQFKPQKETVQVAYAGQAGPTIYKPAGTEMVVAVNFNRTPPSAGWRPDYEELGESAGYAICKPDPGPNGSVKIGPAVF
jgi:uncharacterized protein YdcH (DUF465 family)